MAHRIRSNKDIAAGIGHGSSTSNHGYSRMVQTTATSFCQTTTLTMITCCIASPPRVWRCCRSCNAEGRKVCSSPVSLTPVWSPVCFSCNGLASGRRSRADMNGMSDFRDTDWWDGGASGDTINSVEYTQRSESSSGHMHNRIILWHHLWSYPGISHEKSLLEWCVPCRRVSPSPLCLGCV